MRHLRQISDDCLTVNVFAKRERNFEMCFCLIPIGGLQEIAKFHHRFSSIRQLDAHSVFSGNRREDINPLRTSRPGKVSIRIFWTSCNSDGSVAVRPSKLCSSSRSSPGST